MPCIPLAQRGRQAVALSSALNKIRRKTIEPLQNGARLRWQAQSSLANKCAALMANARDDAVFALAALHWYQSHVCQRFNHASDHVVMMLTHGLGLVLSQMCDESSR